VTELKQTTKRNYLHDSKSPFFRSTVINRTVVLRKPNLPTRSEVDFTKKHQLKALLQRFLAFFWLTAVNQEVSIRLKQPNGPDFFAPKKSDGFKFGAPSLTRKCEIVISSNSTFVKL
jgi:hypothetical protein